MYQLQGQGDQHCLLLTTLLHPTYILAQDL